MRVGRRIPHIEEVEVIGRYELRLTFDDGLVRELDLANQLSGPVFEPLRDPAYFARVRVDPVSGSIFWPNEADLDPVVLHGDEDPDPGPPPRLIREYTRTTAQRR